MRIKRLYLQSQVISVGRVVRMAGRGQMIGKQRVTGKSKLNNSVKQEQDHTRENLSGKRSA